jgi:predicted alpha/beta hydrolase family esterase
MKNQSFLLIHGLGGSGPQHWQSWLYTQLKERNCDVYYPTFSNFDAPDKDVWLQELRTVMEQIPTENELTVLAHSLGCFLWLHHASTTLGRSVQRVILVAPPSPTVVIPEASSFYPVPLHESNLLKAANQTTFVLSTNDPYCNVDDIPHFLRMNTTVIAFPKMGHINTESGYGPWPWIMDVCLNGRTYT